MCLVKNWKHLTAFGFALILGIMSGQIFSVEDRSESKQSQTKTFKQLNFKDEGGGMGYCRANPPEKYPADKSLPNNLSEKQNSLQIKSKPRAFYTETARQNNVQGTVILKVTFLANGTVGDIFSVSGLPDGLTEQAIEAAKKIKFEPMKVNGQAKTATKTVQYSFTIY